MSWIQEPTRKDTESPPRVRTIGILVLLVVLCSLSAALLTTSSAPAFAWGSQGKCTSANRESATLSWKPNVFLSHKMRVRVPACVHKSKYPEGKWLWWVGKPYVSFPSQWPSNEGLSLVSGPSATKFYTLGKWAGVNEGKVYAIRYNFTVKQHIWPSPLTNEWDFALYVNARGGIRVCKEFPTRGGRCTPVTVW